jgi:hypothetical protein
MPLTTRAAKGSNLTPAEADAIITKVNTITSAIGGDGVANPAALEAALAAVRAPGGGGGASTYAALADKATANLPGINTPLANSLAGKQAVGSTCAPSWTARHRPPTGMPSTRSPACRRHWRQWRPTSPC